MISWNAKIQSVFETKLAAGFEALEDDIMDIERNAATNVADLFRTLETALEGERLVFSAKGHTNSVSQSVKISKE